jgi:hypothetical protein
MLIVSSTLLLLVNAVTWRRERIFFYRIAILILLYSGVILLDNWIGKYGGLFLSFIMDSFDQVQKFGAMPLQLSAFYLRRLQKPMRPKGKKIYSFFLTKYTDNPFFLFFLIYSFLILFPLKDL